MYSEKLKELRVVDGFKFRFHRIMKNEIQRWACTNKRCNAFLKFDTHGVEIDNNLEHNNHAADEKRSLVRQKLSNSVKRKAVEQLCERPSKIIHSEITPDDLNILDSKDINLIRKNIHTARMSKYPILPKTLLEFYAMVPDVVDKLHTNGGEKWIIDIDNNKGVVCFSTIKNLNFFKKCDAVLMDGTFSSCPSLFNQLFVVHGVKNNIYVPLFFCLLMGKSVTDYCTALEFLKQRSPLLPTTFHIDFEQSIHSAVRLVWPMSKIKGCRFHLGQAWYRKIQSLGLAKVYSTEDEKGNFLKTFFGLPFLSPNEVDDCFTDDLMSTMPADCTAINDFVDYVFLNYINTDSAMFPPEIWAEFSSSISRTTNACESFHAKLNGMFYRSHPNIYQLIEALNEVQTSSYTKMNCTAVRNLKRAKQTVDKEEFISKKMLQYSSGEINRIAFIQDVSKKFLPQNLKL